MKCNKYIHRKGDYIYIYGKLSTDYINYKASFNVYRWRYLQNKNEIATFFLEVILAYKWRQLMQLEKKKSTLNDVCIKYCLHSNI